MPSYPVPAREIRTELLIQKSRFITTAAPVFSVEEARDFIAKMKREYSDASHNVPAYLIGYGPSVIAHSSDDGEPAGTAGRPALRVLSGSGFGDIAVVVTRYFGGIKLGTGGLVKAYTESVQQTLAILPAARKILTHTARLVIPYHGYEYAKLIIGKQHGQILNQDFSDLVSITIEIPVEYFEEFLATLTREARRIIDCEILKTEELIYPIE